ncbi:MAG: P-loop NTPase [Flavobacteriaceae bacterium]|mgnify:FL=1|tara:strand:- start:2453 stop:3583 length:1131 start_codon:yes stop_codon:yes gene_type:complete
MKIDKKSILETLKLISFLGEKQNIFDAGYIRNIMVFGDQVDIDLLIKNPSLQARKKVEVEILKAIHKNVYEKAKINIKFEVLVEKKPDNIIKGKPIKGIDSIIAISSGKGGVGKSTITVNIAITLAEMGCKVGILDADIYGPSIPTMLDIEGSKPLSVNEYGKSKMKPIENYGLKVLSIGFFTKPDQAVIWRGPMASKALNQMIFDAAWGELDFLLIDLPPGTGDIHLSIVQSLPLNGAIVVSTPQNVALSDAKKGIAMFQQESIKVPVLGIIENMSYFTPDELPDNKYYIFGKKGAEYLANDKNVPFLGGVPIVQSIREASDFGHPVALQKNTELAEKFKLISRNLVSQLIKRNKSLPPTKALKITNMVGCDAIK